MTRVVHVTTVPHTLTFLTPPITLARSRGWDVHAISSGHEFLQDYGEAHDIEVHEIPMTRRITPGTDLRSLLMLTDMLIDLEPDIVHGHTPKAGLLSMMAATAAGVPIKIYQMHGLLTLTARGLRHALLASAERTSCRLADAVVCVSHSLREVAHEGRLCPRERSDVLLGGSNGVDAAERFNPARYPNARAEIRAEHGIPLDAPVVGFVGRLVRDKGIVELTRAWQAIRRRFDDAHLLVVGPYGERDTVPDSTRRALSSDPSIHLLGYQSDTPPLYAAMDLLTLPTYREGFPTVPMEAAAMGIPTVATRAPGCVDAVVEGGTGALVPIGDPDALARAIIAYLADPGLRARHGLAARERVLRDFRPEAIAGAMLALYDEMLGTRAPTLTKGAAVGEAPVLITPPGSQAPPGSLYASGH